LIITAALLIHPSNNSFFCGHLNWTLSPSILNAQANFKRLSNWNLSKMSHWSSFGMLQLLIVKQNCFKI
jgi:hypothetical protein